MKRKYSFINRKQLKYYTKRCSFCNKKLSLDEKKIKRSKTGKFFCCRKHKDRYFSGSKSPTFGRHLKQEHKDKISKANKGKLIGDKNPMFNKKVDISGKNYFYKDLGHRCRSSWETNYARVLKYLKIDYKYEPTTFKLKEGDSYTPDFYIIKEDKYIEIKGYVRNKFEEKLKRFQKQYPNIKIEIIGEKEYKNLIEKYQDNIEVENGGKIKQNYKTNWVKIKEIKKTSRNPEYIYNISVEEDDSFVSNGIVTHNTKPHEIRPLFASALRFRWPDHPPELPPMPDGFHYFKRVRHPGTEGKEILRKIANDKPLLKKLLKQAIN